MREIKLVHTQKVALVDDADYPKVEWKRWYLWICPRSYYAKAVIKGKMTSMQAFLLNPPKGMLVDHINGNGLDNRRENLRLVTLGQQRQNTRSHEDSRTSQYKGVHYSKERSKWHTQICINGKQTYVGRFSTEIEAAKAYDRAALKHYGEFAKLNFPEKEKGGAESNGTTS